MSTGLVHLHNFLRWIILAAAVYAIISAYIGMAKKTEYTKANRIGGIVFTSSLDLQLLLGLVLFGVSPFMKAAMQNMGESMKNSDVRFFIAEHPFMMVAAIVVAHVGTALAKRAPDSATKHKKTAIFYTIALVLLLAGIPWGRPLFPGM